MIPNTPLSDEQVKALAPSAFATQPYFNRSERYAFVPTSQVITAMRDNGFQPYSAQQSRCRLADKSLFTKHMIRFRSQNDQLVVVGDTELEVILVNSHDGTSAYNVSLGMFRLACLNGLIVADSLVESIHVRHTGDIVNEVMEATRKLSERAPLVLETVNQWKGITLETAEQKILAEESYALRYDEKQTVSPEALLHSYRHEDDDPSLWNTFNRIQEHLINGGQRYNNNTGRRMRTRSIKGIDQNIKLNRALWSLAEKMAALKTT